MDRRLGNGKDKMHEFWKEQVSQHPSEASPSDAERFRRSLYEPSNPRPERNEGRSTRESSWQTAAREGFQRFEQSYQSGDDDWKHFLTQTQHGKELQAIYLDVKPLMSIYRREIGNERMIEMFHHNAKQDFSVLDLRSMGGSVQIFLEKSVDRVLRAHPKQFLGYDTTQSVSSYLSELGLEPATQTPEHWNIQRGLLHGYTLQASERFAKYQDARNALFDLEDKLPEDSREKAFLQRYLDFQNYDETNAFRETHQSEMHQILDTHLPHMPEDAKQYILDLRYMHAPGIFYASDRPTSPEDQALIQRAREAFTFSGMEDYLKALG